jgi:hypothetical protein
LYISILDFFLLKRFIVSWSNISFLSSSAWAIKAGLIISGISSIGSSFNTFTVKGCSSINKTNSSIGSNIGSNIGREIGLERKCKSRR